MRVHWGKLPLLPTLWLATPLTCYPASLATGPKVCSVTSEKYFLNEKGLIKICVVHLSNCNCLSVLTDCSGHRTAILGYYLKLNRWDVEA